VAALFSNVSAHVLRIGTTYYRYRMALDLTLCLVPKQIEVLFAKAATDEQYAEWMQAIPSLLKGSQDFDYQDESLTQLKRDIAAIKEEHHFAADHYYYDKYRCFATIDYLLDAHIRATHFCLEPALLWQGGTSYPGITAGQGMFIKLYNEAAVKRIALLLGDLTFSDLLVHYDYEKMLEAGVYKLTTLENSEVLEVAFYEIRGIFLLALAEDLLVFKAID